ncbi:MULTISPECIES: hypothetical protein [Shouchella]|uniref:hypothetical protein n=1 Tax=Shouchella TaxID=2893057 RepID=UPI000915EDA3|nr:MULTISPECIES: hypothetical protein [Shouchella]MDO7285868.1 hypothetical protein [Shouchella clausii]MDO7305772.1 hypothetical protein [Shouchella clausii]SHM05118.1 hypothetical protein SAMN05192535_0107 [Shouchella rhizosphaerae]
MKWIQTHDQGYTHEFELEGDRSITRKIVGIIDSAKSKLRSLFGSDVEIDTFDEMDE